MLAKHQLDRSSDTLAENGGLPRGSSRTSRRTRSTLSHSVAGLRCSCRKCSRGQRIYNDLDGDIVNLFRMVRDHGPAFKCVELTPFAKRRNYDAAFSLDPVDNLDRADNSDQGVDGEGVRLAQKRAVSAFT